MRGVLDTLPFSLTVGALGVIFGAGARPAGIGQGAALLMSLLVFSGTAQFAVLGLWGRDTWLLVLSTMFLNARFLLMGASLAARLPQTALWQRALLAFGVTDESYALSIERGAEGTRVSVPYLAGSIMAMYLPWVAGTVLGVAVGPFIPDTWAPQLKAVFPLVFLTLTALCVDTAPKALVALLGATLSAAGTFYLPPGWNVLAAGLLASAAGPLLEGFMGKPANENDARNAAGCCRTCSTTSIKKESLDERG